MRERQRKTEWGYSEIEKKNLPSSWGDVTPSSLWPLRTSIVTGGGGEGCRGERKSEKERKVSTWLEFPWFAMQEGKQVSAINSAHCPPRKASQVPPFGFKSVSFCAPCAELITTVLCLIAAKGRDAFKKSFWSHTPPRVHFLHSIPLSLTRLFLLLSCTVMQRQQTGLQVQCSFGWGGGVGKCWGRHMEKRFRPTGRKQQVLMGRTAEVVEWPVSLLGGKLTIIRCLSKPL